MIPPHIQTEILNRIKAAEQEHQVKVLFAIESGGRAWGFASPNSDYDVRFVYVHPRDWYLTINLEEKRDVIEYPIVDEIDINGWGLRNHEIAQLLEPSTEKQLIPQVKALNEFIEAKLAHYEQHKFQEPEKSPDINLFNQLFQRYL